MSKESTEKQVPPPMGELSVQEGEEDAKRKVNEAMVVMEELGECKTPTRSSNMIPVIQNCPPAPRKKRRSVSAFSSHMKRSSASELKYVVKPEEVESFFQSMFELSRVNKRCRRI